MANSEEEKNLWHYLVRYLQVNIKLIRLDARASIAEVVYKLMTLAIGFAILSGFVFFASIAAALSIGAWLQNLLYGFLSVAGFYLFVFLFFIFAKTWLLKGLEKLIEKEFFKKS